MGLPRGSFRVVDRAYQRRLDRADEEPLSGLRAPFLDGQSVIKPLIHDHIHGRTGHLASFSVERNRSRPEISRELLAAQRDLESTAPDIDSNPVLSVLFHDLGLTLAVAVTFAMIAVEAREVDRQPARYQARRALP